MMFGGIMGMGLSVIEVLMTTLSRNIVIWQIYLQMHQMIKRTKYLIDLGGAKKQFKRKHQQITWSWRDSVWVCSVHCRIYSHYLWEVWKVVWAWRFCAFFGFYLLLFWGCRLSLWLLGFLKTDIIKNGSETEQSICECSGQVLLRFRCEQRERSSCGSALLRGRFDGTDRRTGPVFTAQTRFIHPERHYTHQRPERWDRRAENTADRLLTCTPDASPAGR